MKKKLLILLFILAGNITCATINSSDTVIFDLSHATCTGNFLKVPVSFKSDDDIYALDFSMKYNLAKITYNSIINYFPSNVTGSANYNAADSTLRFSSFSDLPMQNDTPIISIRFNLLSGPISISDFNTISAYLNGDHCSYKIINAPLPASISANGPTSFPAGDSVLLTAAAGNALSYLWSTAAITQSIYVSAAGTYYVTVTNTGGCSSIDSVVVTVAAPFPIELIDFNAKEIKDGVLAQWSTVSEINNDYFILEKESSVNTWQELGRIKGAGNSSTLRNYSFMDEKPFMGINYYRLRQTDYDGNFTYSKTVAVNFSNQQPQALLLDIYPNPANGVVNILLSQSASLKLLNSDGKQIIFLTNLPANQKQEINTSNFASGIYTMKLYNDNFVTAKKIVIQK